MDKKKSINNIQDLGLSAASQQSIGQATDTSSLFLEFFILRTFSFIFSNFYFSKNLFLELFLFKVSAGSRYCQSFKKSINKRFIHN
jgi:hypothetical protein